MAIAAGTAAAIGPAHLLQGCHRYAEAQGLHIAPRCRKAARSRQLEAQIKAVLGPLTAQNDYAKAGLGLFRRP